MHESVARTCRKLNRSWPIFCFMCGEGIGDDGSGTAYPGNS
jgi:hypothetical protein